MGFRVSSAFVLALVGAFAIGVGTAKACPAEAASVSSSSDASATETTPFATATGHRHDPLPRPLTTAPRLRSEDDADTDGFVLGVLAFSLLGFAYWYRRESDSDGKTRAAAAAGLWSLIFWTCTSAMPWLGVVGASGVEAMCFLGAEGPCSTFFPEHAGLVAGPGADAYLFDIYRWHHAVIGIRAGQAIALFFLLPSLIWLLIEPRSRTALGGAAVCGFATAFALLATVYYRAVVPGWLDVHIYRTFDIALLSSAAIVVVITLIVANAVRDPRPTLPRARARRRS